MKFFSPNDAPLLRPFPRAMSAYEELFFSFPEQLLPDLIVKSASH